MPMTDEQANELAQLRARAAQLEQDRAAREAEADAEDALLAARRTVRDQEALDKAIAEHGRVDVKLAVLETAGGLVILKKPSSMRFARFQDQGDYNHKELFKLVNPSIVYPDSDRFSALYEDEPALLLRCANAIARLAGVRKQELEAK